MRTIWLQILELHLGSESPAFNSILLAHLRNEILHVFAEEVIFACCGMQCSASSNPSDILICVVVTGIRHLFWPVWCAWLDTASAPQ